MSSIKRMTPRWVKAPVIRLIEQFRRATWRSRALPDFIIIGTQKSVTSSLYSYLGQHPQILRSFGKEVHFFDGGLNPEIDNFEKGEAWYRAHFPLRNRMAARSRTFEATPLYLFNPLAPKRISDIVPEAKLIAVLRNPTDRAISHYFHSRRGGHESLPIMDALQEEEQRLQPVLDDEDYKSNTFIHHSYKSRGLYRRQIERYLDHFPLSQLLVLNSDEVFRDPGNTLRRVFEFVGADAGVTIKDLKPRNVASNKSDVEPSVYAYLNEYFLPHNQALYELIGKDFEW